MALQPAVKPRSIGPQRRAYGDCRSCGKSVQPWSGASYETLTFYGFTDSHWIKLRTNNPLERIMREIRRRTRVVGAFPDGKSCLNLAAARLRHIAGTQWSTRKYMNMIPLFADQTKGAVVA